MTNKIAKNNNLIGKNSGRPKGSLNKTTKSAKEAIALAADNLGGSDRLVEWAKEDPANERAFWSSIYPKLLPLQVDANVTLNPIAQLLNEINGTKLTPNE